MLTVFSQNAPSKMFNKVLNTSVILLNFLNAFSLCFRKCPHIQWRIVLKIKQFTPIFHLTKQTMFDMRSLYIKYSFSPIFSTNIVRKRSSHGCSIKKSAFKFWKILRKTPALESLFKKETSTQVLSCKYYEIFKKTSFWRPPPTADFEVTENLQYKFI